MSDEKTEKPTPKKLRDAKKKGEVPRTKELSVVCTLLFAFTYIMFLGDGLFDELKATFISSFTFNFRDLADPSLLASKVYTAATSIAKSLIGFFIAILVINVASNTMLGGFIFVGEKLIPDFKKLNPISGIKNIFSVKQLVELLKSIVKALLILVPLYMIIDDKFFAYASAKLLYAPKALLGVLAKDIILWGMIFSSLYVFVAALDIPFQIFNFTKQQRMSKEDIKREYKDSEGNPEIKSKRKQKQMELSRNAQMNKVEQADILIVNPTHYAVGLKYDKETTPAPIVVALGEDHMALRLRAKAAELEIPVLEIPPLARVLYRLSEVGQVIPEDLYDPVAVVIAYIYGLDDRLAFDINERFVQSLNIDEDAY
ncbi:flagellar biosynthesis protein FlhB [Vibrio sp. D431a]|uniref:flagellar biosynthesis protein FlhB n=1 Tax=Vibrio sp. D431a TaxID=2837388 RepID=UPI002556A9FD|nr:flagellar biosynthesis protein FlhB [Vibrio sp. D431a]MDK9793926.1 flagellar biosynthesis protein FlhB [Vibrio sp. D431a]